MRPSFYPTVWFRVKLPGRSVRRPQSFADSSLRFGLAGRQLTVSLRAVSEARRGTPSGVEETAPGALSIQRLERGRPCLRRTRRIMGFEWGGWGLGIDGGASGMAVGGRQRARCPLTRGGLGMG